MATKSRQSAEPRRDASGRELFDWEVDPADQVTRKTAATGPDDPAPTEAAMPEDAEGGQ